MVEHASGDRSGIPRAAKSRLHFEPGSKQQILGAANPGRRRTAGFGKRRPKGAHAAP